MESGTGLFQNAKILGLTATPTPEAYAFFNNNIIEQYTYDDSVVDGVNVPARVYRIITDVTAHGGTIDKKSKVVKRSDVQEKKKLMMLQLMLNTIHWNLTAQL